MIDDNELERFLEPLIAEWNRLTPEDLRALRAAPLPIGSEGRVTYITEERSPFGYDYVELEIHGDPRFTMRMRVHGQPGDLSANVCLPAIHVEGDVTACAAWLRTNSVAGT